MKIESSENKVGKEKNYYFFIFFAVTNDRILFDFENCPVVVDVMKDGNRTDRIYNIQIFKTLLNREYQ